MLTRHKIASALLVAAITLSAHSSPQTYRLLSPQEIKIALALKNTVCEGTVPPFAKPGLPLPAGATIESEAYQCLNYDGKVYSFVQAHTPRSKEILFICESAPGWPPGWRWVTDPTACGAAIIDRPANRAIELEEGQSLASITDAQIGRDTRTTSEGWEYYRKVKLQFEPVMRRCAKSQPPDEDREFAWMGRVSPKGKVARTGVISGRGAPQASYSNCINKAMQAVVLPTPPIRSAHDYFSGGWPVTIAWRHSNAGDRIVGD